MKRFILSIVEAEGRGSGRLRSAGRVLAGGFTFVIAWEEGDAVGDDDDGDLGCFR